MSAPDKEGKITTIALVSMIFTTIFGFSNIHTSYFMMGYAAIPWFILASIAFFLPYALMVAEYGVAFKESKGGIFAWMSKSVNTRFGFMGMFMWYTAFIIYFVNVATAFFLKISAFLFGSDTTATWSLFGLSSNQTIGILAVVLIVAIGLLSTRGVKSVQWMAKLGSISLLVLEAAVIIGSVVILACNGGFAQPVSAEAFLTSPNAGYTTPIAIISFATIAIGAYGGIEATGGLADKVESKSSIPKGIIGAALAITVSYSVLIFCLGAFVNWNDVLGTGDVNMANVQYVIMYNLGSEIAKAIGMGASAAAAGEWVTRLYGLMNAFAVLGSITVFFYGPLTQLIEGTPKEIWPAWLVKKDEKTGVPVNAIWVQTGIICIFLLLISFGGTSVNAFWNLILLMTNVAMTIPYMFVAAAYPSFKSKDSIEKPMELVKSRGLAIAMTVLVLCSIGFANLFTIINPAMSGDVMSTVLQAAGPIAFALIGLALYHRYTRKHKEVE